MRREPDTGRPCDVAVIPRTRTRPDLPRSARDRHGGAAPGPRDAVPTARRSPPGLRRVVAALLDGAILGGATWLVLGSGGLGAVADARRFDVGPSERDGRRRPVAWFTSPWLVGLLLAMLALQGWTGATPGKRRGGVAIVRVSDGRAGGVPRIGAAGRRAPDRRDLPHRVPAAAVERPQADVRRLDRRDPGRPDPRASGAPVVRAVPARAVGVALDRGERRGARRVRARRRVLHGVAALGRLVGDVRCRAPTTGRWSPGPPTRTSCAGAGRRRRAGCGSAG